MHIPYTTAVRPDTGLTNPKLGMWLFLASEVMFFGALFSAYALLRTGAAVWPDQSTVLDVRVAAANTVILVASSVAIGLSVAAIRAEQVRTFQLRLGVSLGLGTLFLLVKAAEYGDKLARGLVPATDTFLALYFTLTGVHALHLAAGLLVNAYLLGPGVGLWRREPQRFASRVELAAIYWHFVDAVWLVIFVVLYLL